MTKFDLNNIDMNKLNANLAELSKNITRNQFPMNSINGNMNIKNIAEERDKINKENFIKAEKYEQDVLNTLKQIEYNTANLTEVVNLIQDSNDKQDEIFAIIIEILTMAKLKDEKEVVSTWRAIMDKANTVIKDGRALSTIYSFGLFIYNSTIQNPEIIKDIVNRA